MPSECRCVWPATSPAIELGRRRRRHAGRDQAHGPVVQRARRPAGFVPLDPAVDRVGGARVDARDRQGGGVHPGAVVIPVRQEGGPPAGDGVQVRRRRQPAGKGRHGPAAAEHPGARGQGRTVVGHGLQAFVPGPQAEQVAAQALQAAADRVHVRVAEGRQRQPPAQVDDAGAAAGQLPYLVVACRRPAITPSRTARAWTNPDGCAGVRIFPPARTRSASVLLTAIASHLRPGPRQGTPGKPLAGRVVVPRTRL